MDVIALQSGSKGNSIFVESNGTRLLIDAGISGKQAEQRLAARGRSIRDVDALLISHDHRDHSQCMGVYQRRFGIPIHITTATLSIAQRKCRLGPLRRVNHFTAGSTFEIGTLLVETIPTPHDGVDGVCFVIDDGRHRVGILTDLGHAFDQLDDVVASLDAVVIESNHDLEMLAGSLYPESLKRRISGAQGHLSNRDALSCCVRAAPEKLKWACLAHLSEESNTAELAVATHREVWGDRFRVLAAPRDSATEVMVV